MLLRFILSLASCKKCLVIDDQLNILPISSHAASIEALPPQAPVSRPGSENLGRLPCLPNSPVAVANLISPARMRVSVLLIWS